MTSKVQKVLEAEKRRKLKRESQSRSIGQVTRDLITASGIFKSLSSAQIHSQTMEKNKILPAVNDRNAVIAYKILRTRVLQRMRSNNWHSLIITGAGPEEGKTLTAANLAISISNDVNQAVILIDLDLQRPALAKYFGLDVKASIGDYLNGKADINDVVYAPEGMDRIVIIPNRDPVPESSELLASPRMRSLMEWMKNQGSETISIFDMPPVLACDDVLAFSPYADAILMVVAEGKTDRGSVSRTMELLADHNLLGVVLNQTREKSSVYRYY